MKKFELTLQPLSTIIFPPYKGATFRGGFGYAFKKVACSVKKQKCDSCILKNKCIYSYIFETPPPPDSEILRKYEKAPHPFVIEPPLETKRVYKLGESLSFNLILIGRAIDYLPYFIYTFEQLGKDGIGQEKGKFMIEKVAYEGKTIYNSKDRQLTHMPTANSSLHLTLQPQGTNDITSVSMNFLTPTRMVVNEDLVVDIEFHHLARTLLRRISTISYFHYGQRLDLDFKGLIEQAHNIKVKERNTHWYDWERYSTRQKTEMNLGGFVGQVTFEGELAEFMPFIKIGEMLHVGKGTSFGLGKYEIVRLE